YGAPSDSSGGGNAFGGRASLGLGTITLTAGVASWKAANQNARATSYGGTAAFRLIGGSLIPVSVNLQLGAAHNAQNTSGLDTVRASTTVLGTVGLSVPLPTPGISIEPFFSPGIRSRWRARRRGRIRAHPSTSPSTPSTCWSGSCPSRGPTSRTC